jgi:putative addiction module killer protein
MGMRRSQGDKGGENEENGCLEEKFSGFAHVPVPDLVDKIYPIIKKMSVFCKSLSRKALFLDNVFPVGYNIFMKYELHSTVLFDKWFHKLNDAVTKRKILARLARIENGNFGDFKQLYTNLYELRFFFGSGIRIYYTIRNGQIILLLAGGDKASQKADIQKAKDLLNEMEV